MEIKSRTEYSILNIITGFAGYAANTAAGYVCRIFFARLLTEEYLGLSSLLTNYLSMLSIAELGIGTAIVYALYQPIAAGDQKKIASLMRVYRIAYSVIGIVILIAGIATIPLMDFVIGDHSSIAENVYVIYGLFLANTVIGYFFSYRSALITAYQRNYIVIGSSYIISILQSIIQIGVLAAFQSYYAYLLVQLSCSAFYNLFISWKAKHDYPFMDDKSAPPLEKNERRRIFKDVKALIIYRISGVAVNNTDSMVITYFSGLGINGLATNYSLLSTMLTSMISQVFSSLTASIGNLNAVEQKENQYRFFKVLNLSNFWLYGWAAVGMAFVSGDIVHLCYGEKYVMDFRIPIILAVNLYMLGMQNAVWTYKNTKGMFKYGQYILIFTAVINLAGDVVFGKIFGVFGIYLATAVARGVTNTWYEPYALFKYGFEIGPVHYLWAYLRYMVILIVTGVICGFLCSLCHFSLLLSLLMKVVICSVVPNLIFFLVFRNSAEFAYLKKKAVQLIAGKIKG